ncbi:Complement factor H-related protein 3, partial [Nibea albiflora]
TVICTHVVSELLRCGTPPFIEGGGIKYTTKSHYDHNERVEYMCQPYYTMEGDPYKTCINGEWTGHMRCLKPCIAKEDIFRQHNITLESNNRKYFTHDEYIEFKCTTGVPVGEMALHQRCNSGVLHLPTCQ